MVNSCVNQEQLFFCHALQCLHVIVCLLYLIHMEYMLSVLYFEHMATFCAVALHLCML